MSHEILIFADGEKRIIKPAEYLKENFVLILLGLCQYGSDIKLSKTIVNRDLQNNIIYFRDILPVYSNSWDIYMNAVRFNSFAIDDLPELKQFINIIGGDKKVEKRIIEFENKNIIDEKYLNPKIPEDDLYDLYIFKLYKRSSMNWPEIIKATEEYTLTTIVEKENDLSYCWFRKPNFKTIY